MKYYSGAEIQGTVYRENEEIGLPNARIIIERDAFSGEGVSDDDNDTYWIPIGFTDTDENGDWSYTAPAGQIRVSAFAGVYDDTEAIQSIQSGEFANGIGDVLTEVNTDRQVYAITSVLGQVANMTWLGESTLNVTGAQADRMEDVTTDMDIEVEGSGVSGTVEWTGFGDFSGEPLVETDFILRNIWSMTENYTLTTTNGSFDSDESRVIQGTVREELPVGFQRSEYVEKTGFVDLIVERKDLREKIRVLLSILLKKNSAINSATNETSEDSRTLTKAAS